MTTSVIIIPVLNNPELSLQTLRSAHRQLGGSSLILVIDQGSDQPTKAMLESYATPTVLIWRHVPPLPSLAATWNAALTFAWRIGAEDALVLNNDVEIAPEYYRYLRQYVQAENLLFLSGIGVRPEEYTGTLPPDPGALQHHPDFSAYLITRECHQRFPFDENFVPAYCEDVDLHRRIMLAGDGHRIGKVNYPFAHHGSSTLKTFSEEQRQAWEDKITKGSRAYYQEKWGGPVNQERWCTPFGGPLANSDTATTDHLRKALHGQAL